MSKNMDYTTANILAKHSEALSSRPGMFVGNNVNISTIETHMDGYFQALYDAGLLTVRNIFAFWVSIKYAKWPPQYTWGNFFS